MAEKIMQVVVLDIKNSPSSDNDAIVEVYSKKGIFFLLAKGINKSESKNRTNLQLGSLVEIEFFQARIQNKMSLLKKATLISDIDYANRFNLIYIQKAITLLKQFPKAYYPLFESYVNTLNYLGIGKNSLLFTFLLSHTLNYFGLGVNVSKCCECNSPSNLCDFKFYKGGFLCGTHMVNQRWTKELKSIYYMYHDIKIFLQICISKVNQTILCELKEYLEENGIFLN
ncbi:DNA repair protein RecO [Mycoplasmopsis caviae]|uniref:DNA repair protein RecO n=1 Tax=Mycoplasmopsis caviae TaxID=55603 RepID=A0A3P8KCV6_9BACT|nr:DNA repair protein RecO [Mycoplasmopsis caviae]UUD34788.1 DNA repair protein RecO [Mycoplasmopsis caviae]VDR42354.1 recombinational DNA repair protein O [Mycoplasmopsis caviae]